MSPHEVQTGRAALRPVLDQTGTGCKELHAGFTLPAARKVSGLNLTTMFDGQVCVQGPLVRGFETTLRALDATVLDWFKSQDVRRVHMLHCESPSEPKQ